METSYEGYLRKMHPDDRERVHNVMMRVLTERMSVSYEERILRPNGGIRICIRGDIRSSIPRANSPACSG